MLLNRDLKKRISDLCRADGFAELAGDTSLLSAGVPAKSVLATESGYKISLRG